MCTYNGARFLREQLDSLAAQTYLPTELVICDDISTDETIDIVSNFASSAPFNVRIIINENRLFFQRNFVKAAASCSSELIAFCDQDDIWMPEKLAIIVARFKDPDIMLVAHQARLIDEAGAEIAPSLPDADFAPVYNQLCCRPWNFPRGFTQVFRNKVNDFAPLHENTKGFSNIDPYIPHDLWAQLICNSLGKVLWLDIPLANYRQHRNNLFGARAHELEIKKSDVINNNFYSSKKAYTVYSIFSASEKMPNLFQLKNKIIEAKFHWEKVTKIFDIRHKLYSEKNMTLRIKYFLSLLQLNAYNPYKRWSFSRRSVLKDAFVAIFDFQSYFILKNIFSLRRCQY